MYTKIFRVKHQDEPTQVLGKQSDKPIWRCNITLQEMGGSAAGEFQATLLGNDAQCRYRDQELVVATLRFTTREYEGRVYQNVTVTDIMKFYGQKAF